MLNIPANVWTDGKLAIVNLGMAINTYTNERMVIYCPVNNHHLILVTTIDDFQEKFRMANEPGIYNDEIGESGECYKSDEKATWV